MQSKAATVAQYLAELPEDRRAVINALREVILRNLDKDYEEVMNYGMIGYVVPHRVYPSGYHCNPKLPLPFAGLASQKGAMSLYLCALYTGSLPGKPSEYTDWFVKAWKATGKKLDMGKSCIRFKKLEDVPLDVVGEAFRRLPPKAFIAMTEAVLAAPRPAPARSKSSPKSKAPAKAASRKSVSKSSTTARKKKAAKR